MRNTERYNGILLERLARFLNFNAAAVDASQVDKLASDCSVSKEEAFKLLFAANLGMDIADDLHDREMYGLYFDDMLKKLDYREYAENAYLKNVKIPQTCLEGWQFRRESYKPYEAFVYDDFDTRLDGRVIPQIGYFDREFAYPAVLQNGREWMLITPNEINTMRGVVDAAQGDVLTYGLGLGYFAYMASEKPCVSSVTVVERDESVIKLFEKHVLPQFAHKEKISVVKADAFEFARREEDKKAYGLIFTDLWHDAADGVDAYLKMWNIHRGKGGNRMYWIEKTLKYYLG